MTGIKNGVWLLAFGIGLQSCANPPHPTEGACQSTENAARMYFTSITKQDSSKLKFVHDDFGDGLAGYKVYGNRRMEFGALVIQESDCSLKLFSDLAIH